MVRGPRQEPKPPSFFPPGSEQFFPPGIGTSSYFRTRTPAHTCNNNRRYRPPLESRRSHTGVPMMNWRHLRVRELIRWGKGAAVVAESVSENVFRGREAFTAIVSPRSGTFSSGRRAATAAIRRPHRSRSRVREPAALESH